MRSTPVITATLLGVATAIQRQPSSKVVIAKNGGDSYFQPILHELNYTHWNELPKLFRPLKHMTTAYLYNHGHPDHSKIEKIPEEQQVVVWAHNEFSAHEHHDLHDNPTCVQDDDCYERDLRHPNLRGKFIVSIQPPWSRITMPGDDPEESMCFVNVHRKQSIGVPYPSAFRAKDSVDIANRMYRILSSSRTTLVTFVGGLARGVGAITRLRNKLAHICVDSEECNFLNCSVHSFCRDNLDTIIEANFKSDFCLMPPGDWPNRQALFDALSTGCIPVFFSSCLREDLIYETTFAPFVPRYKRTHYGPGKWAVLLDSSNLTRDSFLSALLAVDVEKKMRMRKIIASVLPRIQYSDSKGKLVGYEDVTDVLASVLQARGVPGADSQRQR